MKNPAELELDSVERLLRARLRESADPDHPFGLEDLDHPAQVLVADGVQGASLAGSEFIGGAIAAGGFHEDEGAVVGHEMLAEERLRRTEMTCDRPPQTRAAHLAAAAGEALDRTRRMFVRGPGDGLFDSHPVAHARDFAEGYARLCHAEGAWIHAEKNHALAALAESAQVGLVAPGGVGEGIVDVGDRRSETKRVDGPGETASRLDQSLCTGHGKVLLMGVGIAG